MLPSKDTLERLRLAFGTLIGALLFALLVMLFVWPATVLTWVGDRLSAAELEITEFAVFGVRLRSLQQASQQAQDQLAVARSEIDRLEAENARLQTEVAERFITAPDPSVAPAIEPAPAPSSELRDQLNQAIRSLEDAQQAVGSRTEAPPAERSWIAIFGADREVPAAEDEYNRLNQAGYDGAMLWREGFYRTVAFFPSRSEALGALPALARVMGREGYVREFNSWCPGARASAEDDRIVICSAR